jgi:cobalamin-dependent methionine synthase I
MDIIGLSGLITPSLDEMGVSAKELDKKRIENSNNDWRCYHISSTYCSKKIAIYRETVIHVNDASKTHNDN